MQTGKLARTQWLGVEANGSGVRRGGAVLDPWLVALVALGVGLLWRYPAPYPDDTLAHWNAAMGAWPRISPNAPLWHGLAGLLCLFPRESFQARMQGLGLGCLVLAVALFHRIVTGFLRRFMLPEQDTDPVPRWSAAAVRTSALAASACFLASAPIWRIAQSGQPEALGLLLATATGAAAFAHVERPSTLRLLVWAVLAAAGSLESAFAMLLLPLWAALFLFGSEEAEASMLLGPVPSRSWTAGAAFGTTAFAVLGFSMVSFRHAEGFALRGGSRWLHALLFVLQDRLAELRGLLPTVGWLLMVFCLLAPWGLAVGLSRQVKYGLVGFGGMLLFVLSGLLAVLQVVGLRPFAAWNLLASPEFQQGALALNAMTLGLASAACLLTAGRCLAGWRTGASADGTVRPPVTAQLLSLVAGASCVLAGIALAGVAVTEVARRREVPERQALALLSQVTSRMVADAGPCQWIATDGSLDHGLRLAAWRAGSKLQPLCIAGREDAWTRRAVERRLPDEGSRSVFRIGAKSLVEDWLAHRRELAGMLAAQVGFDLWEGREVRLLPWSTVFRPVNVEGTSTVWTAQSAWTGVQADWAGWAAQCGRASGCTDPLLRQRVATVRHQTARLANELGGQLEDAGRVLEAQAAYESARMLNPENLSARLNLLSVFRRQEPPPPTGALEGEIRALLRTQGRQEPPPPTGALEGEIRALLRTQGRWGLLNIVRMHGTVRNGRIQEILRLRNAMLATPAGRVSRSPGLLDVASGEMPGSGQLRLLNAGLHLKAGDPEASRQGYQSVLDANPKDTSALLGMAVVEARSHGVDSAAPWIDQARVAGADPVLCDQLHALLVLEAGDPVSARVLLEPHLRQKDSDVATVFLAAQASLLADDTDRYLHMRERLGRMSGTQLWLALLGAQEAERKGDLPTAVSQARMALECAPGNPRLLAHVLRLLVEQGDYEGAHRVAETLLGLDIDNGLAHFAMGTHLLLKGDLGASEFHLSRAVAASRSAAALNNLAFARLQLRNLDTARQDAEEATRLAPWHPETWDTLAAVALAQGDLPAADNAARQAVVLAPDSPTARLRAGEVALALGDLGAVQAHVRQLQAIPSGPLSPEDRQRLDRLREGLRLPATDRREGALP